LKSNIGLQAVTITQKAFDFFLGYKKKKCQRERDSTEFSERRSSLLSFKQNIQTCFYSGKYHSFPDKDKNIFYKKSQIFLTFYHEF